MKVYLLYVDASGTIDLQDNSSNYVLTGVAVHELTWFAVESRLQGLRGRFGLSADTEIHAKDICNPNPVETEYDDFEKMDRAQRFQAWDELAKRVALKAKQKRFQRERPFANLGRKQRSELYESVLDLIGTHDRGVRLFCSAIDKKYVLKTRGLRDLDIIALALEQIVARFGTFLERHGRSSNRKDKGMLVFDNEPTLEAQIREIFNRWRCSGHRWGNLDQIIDVPFFIDSQACSGVQAADICAYACRRHIEHPEGAFELANLDRILPNFDHAIGVIHGFRHEAPHSCACRFCKERRGSGRVSENGVDL